MIKLGPLFLLLGLLVFFGSGACGNGDGEKTPMGPNIIIEPDLVPIPAGCFDMGGCFFGASTEELPCHNVCLDAFEMYTHEVTNGEYSSCVRAGRCTAPLYTSSYSRSIYYGSPWFNDFPVVGVNWNQARNFCAWAGKRLPSEAEWEYAAKGGLVGRKFPWGNWFIISYANSWNSGDEWDNDTSPVESFLVNGYGLYDMAGNVFEWVEDDWHGHYSGAPEDGSAWVIEPHSYYRVVRGGAWVSEKDALRVGYRNYGRASSGQFSVGFRCVQ